MRKRSRIPYKSSRRQFRRGSGFHPRNVSRERGMSMRGGIRL